MKDARLTRPWAKPRPMLVHTAIFALLAMVSQGFLAPNFPVPALWLPAGYSLGLLLLYHYNALPTVLLGSLTAAITYTGLSHALGEPYQLSGVGSLVLHGALAPIIAWWTYRKSSGTASPLISYTAFLWLLGSLTLACFITTLPLLAVTLLVPDDNVPSIDALLLASWFGTFLGSLTLAPPTLSLLGRRYGLGERTHYSEWGTWSLSMLFILLLARHEPVHTLFLVLPLMIWAATRFTLAVAVVAMSAATLASMAVVHMALVGESTGADYLLAQTLITMMLAASCYVRVLLEDRHRIESGLESIVEERTRELQLINHELKDEIFVRQQAEKSFRRSSRHYRALFETASNPIIVIDEKLLIRQWNGAAETLFGYSRDEALARNLLETFIPSEQKDEMAWKILKVLNSGMLQDTLETEVHSYDGASHTLLWNLNRLHEDEDDGRPQLILIGQDISEIRRTQDQLHYLAHFDVLTDTANRRLFEDRCNQAVASALRHGHRCALIGLDIDHFKRINDTLGHDAGDTLLQELARRIGNSLREEDTIARLGGDEFAVLLNQVNGAEGAEKVGRTLLDVITQPITVPGGELVITSSIGITVAPDDGRTYEDLLKNADMAMYRAKKAGRNNLQFFSADMNDDMQRQLKLEKELREGILEGQLDLYYQPVLNARTGRIAALEALLRWDHPTRGLLTPPEFIDVAEQTGQLQPLGEWICHNACLQARAIQAMSGYPVPISINLSSRQYNHPKLADQLDRVIRSTGLDPGLLQVEIDERILSSRIEETQQTLEPLKALGIGLVLDRFGSGLSSLRLLRELPFDQVKIDQHLIQHAPLEENTAAIVHTLINLARQLSLTVAAAGVETAEEDTFLRHAGCHLLQGHRFCTAISSNELATLFRAIREGRELLPTAQFNLSLPSQNGGRSG